MPTWSSTGPSLVRGRSRQLVARRVAGQYAPRNKCALTFRRRHAPGRIEDASRGRGPAFLSLIPGSNPPLHHLLLQLGNGLGGVQALGADLGAVENSVAAVDTEGVFQVIETLAGCLVPTVRDPTLGL